MTVRLTANPWSSGNQLLAADLNDTFAEVNPKQVLTAGETITAGQALCAYWYQSDGGVQPDNEATATINSGTTVTQSYTTGSQSNRIMIVSVTTNQTISTLTYNGVSLLSNLITSQSLNAGYTLYAYYLIAPTTGANNLICTIGSTGYAAITINTFYNALQTGQPDADTKVAAGSAGAAVAITTVANGALVLAVTGTGTGISSGSYGSITNAANGTQSVVTSGTAIHAGSAYSNIVFPGAQTFTVTHSSTFGGSSWTEGIIAISISPFTTPASGVVVPASSASVAVGQNLYAAFCGFAESSVSAGSTLEVTVTGGYGGLSGLTPNVPYYLNDTAGTIGKSPGTNTRKVGIALSTTSILVTNIW